MIMMMMIMMMMTVTLTMIVMMMVMMMIMVMIVMIMEGERSEKFLEGEPLPKETPLSTAAAAFALLISNPFLAGLGKVQFQKMDIY